jgi:hypothetical protein
MITRDEPDGIVPPATKIRSEKGDPMDDKKKRAFLPVAIVLCHLLLGAPLDSPSHAGEKGTFSGSWMTNGSKEVLPLGKNRETALFKLAGPVNLENEKIGKQKDFHAQCIGLSDFSTGSDIRCVWRTLDGEEIYLTFQGTRMEQGSRVTGNIVGGTGAFDGITGYLHFTWTSMSFAQVNEENGIGGFSKDVTGSYQLP